MYLLSMNSSRPSWPPSRPRPDCLTPPNGAAGAWGRGVRVNGGAQVDAGLQAGPARQLAQPSREPPGELVGHPLVHVEPVGRGAGLTAVAHLGQESALDRGVEVGVLEDQER